MALCQHERPPRPPEEGQELQLKASETQKKSDPLRYFMVKLFGMNVQARHLSDWKSSATRKEKQTDVSTLFSLSVNKN